ncbi:uncharacterized protein LOC119547645 [Drosophila subpulchrella]|uniref:uncharacterized protein LOC119547645 n=1 Tax=Drosophila subpulchrella TaxID=1486046 RepID=UPI0018A1A94A|nr:uncharacterized protein LOC119547645 [Drosophila subpulchrella]
MSPKFAISILLFSCVLLGFANAQQMRYPQHRQQTRYQQAGRYNSQRVGTRNLDGSGSVPPSLPPPDLGLPPAGGPLDGGAINPDCMPNQLASGNVDNKKPRPRH